MTVKQFKYEKKKTGEVKEYTVLILKDNGKLFGGIDYTKLNKQEIEEVTKIQMEYEKKLHPFVKKAYRNFITINVQEI